MFKKITTAIALCAFHTPAHAGFESWTSKVETNPFSGGITVSALYVINQRSQVSLRCDTAKVGLELIAIPGWEATADILDFQPEIKIAVDGKIIVQRLTGRVGAYGENLAGTAVTLTKAHADELTDGLSKARRQIAIEDGISNKPFLLSAKGSTATAQKLKQCYEAQKGAAAEPVSDDEVSKQDRIAEIKLEIEDLRQKLLELESSE